MKILKILRKKWLQLRISIYSLKSQDALSKSIYYHELFFKYCNAINYSMHMFGKYDSNSIRYYELCKKCISKSNHYKYLFSIYSNRKIDLEKKL